MFWMIDNSPLVFLAQVAGFEVIYYKIQWRNNNDVAVTWVLSSGIVGIGRNGGVEFEKEHNQDGHYRVQNPM